MEFHTPDQLHVAISTQDNFSDQQIGRDVSRSSHASGPDATALLFHPKRSHNLPQELSDAVV
jgi:hypothetical protein